MTTGCVGSGSARADPATDATSGPITRTDERSTMSTTTVTTVEVAGLTVSRFERDAAGLWQVVLDDDLACDEIVLDQRLTVSQMLDMVQTARAEAIEHGESVQIRYV